MRSRCSSAASPARAARSRRTRWQTATPSSTSSSKAFSSGSSGATSSCAASSARAASSASGATPTCSGACAAPRSRRCARRWSPPEQAALGRFLPAWHGIDRRASLREALVPLQALPLPVSLWESEVLRRRVPGYQPASLDALCATGEVVWVGAGLDRVALYFRDDAPLLGAPGRRTAARRRGGGRPSRGAGPVGRVLARPARHHRARSRGGAAGPLGARLGGRGDERRLDAASCRTPLRHARCRSAAAPLLAHARGRDDLDAGALVAHLTPVPGGRRPPCPGGAAARAAGDHRPRRRPRRGHRRRLRRRLRRAARARDDRRLPPRLLRRGARGAQFALAGAVERLRELRSDAEDDALVLAAADPAQPYGAALPWPRRAGARAARVAGAHVVLLGGTAALYVERGGRTLVPLREPDEEWLRPALHGARRLGA